LTLPNLFVAVSSAVYIQLVYWPIVRIMLVLQSCWSKRCSNE